MKEPKTKEPTPRVKWEGDCLDTVKSWPKEVRENIGGDLRRLEDHEELLDFDNLGYGLWELRDSLMNVWYRLIYWLNGGWIYVLNCFEKKTNQTPQGEINLANARRTKVLKRKDPPYQQPEDEEEKESA